MRYWRDYLFKLFSAFPSSAKLISTSCIMPKETFCLHFITGLNSVKNRELQHNYEKSKVLLVKIIFWYFVAAFSYNFCFFGSHWLSLPNPSNLPFCSPLAICWQLEAQPSSLALDNKWEWCLILSECMQQLFTLDVLL